MTLFPEMFRGPFDESLIARAREKGLLRIRVHDLRDFSRDPRHRTVDDKPFGGGPGMVLKVEPIYDALKALGAGRPSKRKSCVVYLSPQGEKLTQGLARELSREKRLVLLCGHYEGVDQRALRWVDREVSIGDYVLTGGEIPAMVLVDAMARMVPGVVKESASVENDSFFQGLLDHAHYTRPREFLGQEVPEALLSGDHRAIEAWRKADALERTRRRRPDFLEEGVEPQGGFKVLKAKNHDLAGGTLK